MSNLATIVNNILADSGIDDINVVVTTGSYANPAWITSLAWTKITGAPANIVTGTGTLNYHAKWVSGSALGNSLIFDDGTNVGINTTSLSKNINLAGTTRHERIYAYPNYVFDFTNSVGETFTWFRLGNATPFSQTRIFYRAGSSNSEEEGEFRISSTCDKPFIEWTRNTYAYHIREVRARMTGGCGSCEIWVLFRHGNSFLGANSNFQWQINGGTDSSFAVVNATGTPGTGTNQKSINTTDGYFYNNSDNIAILGNMSIGTASPALASKLFIEGTSIVLNTEGSSQAKSIYFRYSDGGDLRSDSFLTFSTGGAPSEKVRLTDTGNLGINTTTPQKKLDVYLGSSNNTAASFGNTLSIGEWTGISFGYQELANASYRKSALVFERVDASARGTIHILNNNDADTSSATLANSRLSITSVGLVTIPYLAGSGTRMVVADANGALSTQAIGSGAITGSGTTNYLPKFTGASTIGNSIIFDNGSAVGIGAASMASINTKSVLNIKGAVADGNQIYIVQDNDDRGWRIKAKNDGHFYLQAAYEGSNTDILQITYDTAEARLNGRLTINGLTPFIRIERSGVNTWQIQNNNQVGTITGFAINNITAGTVPFLINQATGNLLLGSTADDGFRLDVNGSGRFSSDVTLSSNGNAFVLLNNTTATTGRQWRVSSGSNGTFFITQVGVADVLQLAPTTGAATISNLAGTGTRIVVADASGTLSASSALSGYVTGSGTTNYVPKWTSGSAIGNSQIFDNGSNVGIFTTTQAWTSLRQSVQVGNSVVLSAGTNYYPYASFLGNNVYYDTSDIARYINSSGASLFYFNAHSGGNFAWFIAPPGTAGAIATFTQAMTLNTSGNLSIGNTNDTYKLDVTGTARFTGQVNSETAFYVSATPPATNGGLINVRDTVTATNVTSFGGVFFNSSPGNDYSIGKLTENGSGFLQIRNANNGTELLRINSIGATTLTCKAPDADRTLPVNVLTLTAEQGNFPYGPFGGSILFKNRSYVSGLVNSARIRSVIYDDGAPANFGGGLWFETTPTPGGTLTQSLKIDYRGQSTFKSSWYEVAAFNSTYGQSHIGIQNNGTGIAVFGSGASVTSSAGVNDVGIGTSGLNNAIVFATGTGFSERMRISSGGLVGINTNAPDRNLAVFGTTRHERTYGYPNNFLPISNSVSFGTVWVHLGTCGAFTTDKIYYRVATNTSEEEGEITISNTCALPFIQWQRNTYNAMVAQVKVRMTGGCGQAQVWLLIRYGSDFGGTNTNFQWQAYNGTDSGFAIVNAVGTPGTGTNEKNIVGSEGYFYANSGSITVADNIGIGLTAPTAKLQIDSALGNDAIRISDTTGNVRMAIGQEASYAGNYINTRNIDMKLQTYLAGGSGGNIIFQTQNSGSATVVDRMRITPAGEIWMGYSSDQGAYLLQVNGAVFASSYFESSDTRLKNITNTHNGLDFGAIEYTWKDGRDTKLHWGYSAQDVMKYIPDAVNENKDGFLSLDYNQAHTYKIAMLEKRITELEQQLKNK